MFEIDCLESQWVAERVRVRRNCAKLPERWAIIARTRSAVIEIFSFGRYAQTELLLHSLHGFSLRELFLCFMMTRGHVHSSSPRLRLASHHLASLLTVYRGAGDAHGSSLRSASLRRQRLLSHAPHTMLRIVFVAVDHTRN